MSSPTANSSWVPFPASPAAQRPVPTLVQLFEMPWTPEERVVIADADWTF